MGRLTGCLLISFSSQGPSRACKLGSLTRRTARTPLGYIAFILDGIFSDRILSLFTKVWVSVLVQAVSKVL